ncbi:hypothetical protein BAC3_02248 [uncultured bacterium]|nr:hypothetical protein BAC3_02248 [uncultured bacterium]
MNKITEHFIEDGDKNRISEVIIFAKNAYLKRQIITETELGVNRFLIEINAFSIDSYSVQASIYGNGEILSVQYKEIPVLAENIRQTDIQSLEIEKRQLAQQRRILEYKLENCAKQEKLLDTVINLPSEQNQQEFKTQYPSTDHLKNTLENLKVMLDLLNQNYADITQQQEDVTTELQKIKEQQLLIEKKLLKIAPQSSTTHKTIEIVFNSHHAERIKIEVAYTALHATWKPAYKVNVNTDLTQINMTLFAHIEQTTGENWKNVKLSVSNAAPIKTTALPELDSWQVKTILPQANAPAAQAVHSGSPIFYDDSDWVTDIAEQAEIDPISEVDVYLAYSRYEEAEKLLRNAIKDYPERNDLKEKLLDVLTAANESTATAHTQPQAKFSQAQQIKSSLSFEYQLPISININSGEGETLLPLITKKLSGEFFYYSVPKKDSSVYLVCEANLEKNLLSGQLNIHFGGRFVGSTLLDEKKAGKALLINLGADRDIKIRREKITDQLTESFLKGMIDRSIIERKLEFRIISENLKDKDIRLKILDAIPIAITDRIKISNIIIKPDANIKDWQKRKGVMQWDIILPSNTSHEIALGFSIKYPKEYKLEL